MKKKYMKPQTEVMELKAQGTLLAGSSLSVSGEVNTGWADSRMDDFIGDSGDDDLTGIIFH